MDIKEKIKVEVSKLLKAGFIKEIKFLEWLVNIVPLKNKGGQIRINKACPKDGFPLPNVDILVDAAVGHKRLSFMDGYSDYNQIFMEPTIAKKTTFRTPFGNYYYKIMSFGLKNAGAITSITCSPSPNGKSPLDEGERVILVYDLQRGLEAC